MTGNGKVQKMTKKTKKKKKEKRKRKVQRNVTRKLLNVKNKKKIIACSSSLYLFCQPIVSEFFKRKSAGIGSM
jgi:hypothetical protein